jgi:hypothetical protein
MHQRPLSGHGQQEIGIGSATVGVQRMYRDHQVFATRLESRDSATKPAAHFHDAGRTGMPLR